MKVLRFDNSVAAVGCPRDAFYRYVLCKRPVVPAPALTFGINMHVALAYRYRMLARGHSATEFVEGRPATATNKLLERLFARQEALDWRNLDTAQRVMHEYGKTYADENVKVALTSRGKPMVEVSFAFPLGTIDDYTILYEGRIDLVAYINGKLFVVDHKTSSILGQSYWDNSAVSAQQRGYCYALRACCNVEPLGYVINTLVARAPSRTGTAVEFDRQTYYTTGELDEWRDNALMLAERFVWSHKTGKWPMQRSLCVSRYGRCDYFTVCSLPAAQRETELNGAAFITKEWSPHNGNNVT